MINSVTCEWRESDDSVMQSALPAGGMQTQPIMLKRGPACAPQTATSLYQKIVFDS